MSSTSNDSAPSSAAAKAPTEEKIQPGDTHCLLFGAARPSDDTDGAHETALSRQFTATKMDLAKMVDWCASFGELNSRPPTLKKGSSARSKSAPEYSFPVLISFLVNDKSLIPSEDMLSPKGISLLKNGCVDIVEFTTKDMVQSTVKQRIQDCPDCNFILFYSGPGQTLADREAAKSQLASTASDKIPLAGVHQALEFPLSTFPSVWYYDYYTDKELTSDIVTALTGSVHPGVNVYLVLQTRTAKGMFRGWQLSAEQRLTGGLSIALFASEANPTTPSEGDVASEDKAHDYVTNFTEYAKPGRQLKVIQADIYSTSLEPSAKREPGANPSLVTIRPEQALEVFLPKKSLPVN